MIFVNQYFKSFRIINILNIKGFSDFGYSDKLDFSHINVFGLLLKLVSFAKYAIEKSDMLREQQNITEKGYKIGSVIPVELASATCELQFNIHECINELKNKHASKDVDLVINGFRDFSAKISIISKKWYGEPTENLKHIDCFDYHSSKGQRSHLVARSRLIYIQTRHRFPALAGLNTLKSIIDDQMYEVIYASLDSFEDRNLAYRFFESLDWLEEMYESSKSINAPLHFTPLMLAESLSLASIAINNFQKINFVEEIVDGKGIYSTDEAKKMKKSVEDIESRFKEKFYKLAHTQLREAEESFTQGAKYYKSISDLYYLFDDFNDRQVHANHALQMGKSDIIALLRSYLQLIK